MAGHGKARLGGARQGWAWRGAARHGKAGRGMARLGMAWQGSRNGEAGRGEARLGTAGRGTARLGMASQGSRNGGAFKTRNNSCLSDQILVNSKYKGEKIMISKRARQMAIQVLWNFLANASPSKEVHYELSIILYALIGSVDTIQDALNQRFTNEETISLMEEIAEVCGKDLDAIKVEKVLH